MARKFLVDSKLENKYWGEAVITSNYIQNRSASHGLPCSQTRNHHLKFVSTRSQNWIIWISLDLMLTFVFQSQKILKNWSLWDTQILWIVGDFWISRMIRSSSARMRSLLNLGVAWVHMKSWKISLKIQMCQPKRRRFSTKKVPQF